MLAPNLNANVIIFWLLERVDSVNGFYFLYDLFKLTLVNMRQYQAWPSQINIMDIQKILKSSSDFEIPLNSTEAVC